MLTIAVQVVIAVAALPVAALLLRDVGRRRRTLASLATAVVVLVFGASILTSLLPRDADVIQSAINIPYNIGLFVLFATYPNGRFVPRWTLVPVLLGTAIQIADAALGFRLSAIQPWWALQLGAVFIILLVGGQLYRFRRRSTVEERRRTSWPVLSGVTVIVGFTVLSSVQLGLTGSLDGEPGQAVSYLLNGLIPFGFAAGLLAPGLFRVDRALRAMIVVSFVALGDLALFAAATGLLPAVGVPVGQAAWIGAVAVAAATRPLAKLGAIAADRLVFGSRSDPLVALAQLGDQLATPLAPERVPAAITDTVVRALALEGASLEQPEGGVTTVGIVTPDAERFPIVYRGERMAELVASPRAGEGELTARDRETLAHLARQAGPALHDARAFVELRDARARIILAREEERRRLRRDLHDDLAPTFAGLGLAAEAARQFSAAGDARAGQVAGSVVDGLAVAARQLRDIAYDLRPPVLDEQGLVAAIEDRIELTGTAPVIRISAPRERMVLPAAVESAALRIVQEAVVNVRRHAAARTCTVRLESDGRELTVTIDDDGIGLPRDPRHGIGLRSMRERVEEVRGRLLFERLAPGTRVRAVLPASVDIRPEGTAGR